MSTKTRPHQRYVPWLTLVFALFIFRVAAQLVQKIYPVTFLPPFEAWYSGALAYPWLLASQALIILAMAWVISDFVKERAQASRGLGITLLATGSVYMAVMLFRLIAAFTFAADHPWLGMYIPAFFHICLASFVLMLAHFHIRNAHIERVT